MTKWTILGIEPTADTSEIKKAYRSKLAMTNPEDKPVEFMELRQAYEDALAWAKEESSRSNKTSAAGSDDSADASAPRYQIPEGPVGDWMKKIIEIYNDFSRRIQVSEWEKALADPICTSIDMGHEAESALLAYMLDCCNLPLEVIRAMDNTFHFEKNKERLFGEYPRDFVTGILLTPLSDDVYGFPYEDFDFNAEKDGNDYDAFLDAFFKFSALTNTGQFDEAVQLLDQLYTSEIYHPNLWAEICKFHLLNNQIDKAEEALSHVKEEHRERIPVLCISGELSIEKQQYDEAIEAFQKVLEMNSDFNWAVVGLVDAHTKAGNYAEAYEHLRTALKNNRYDGRALELEEELIPKLLQVLQTKVADKTADDDEFLRLCGLLIDQNLPQDAKKLLESRQFENVRREALRNFYIGESCMDMEDFQGAVENIRMSRKLLRETMSFTVDEEEKEKKTNIYCHGILMESLACEYMNKLDEALEVLTDGVLDFPDDPMLVCRKAEVLFEMKRYEEAVDCASASIELDDSFHVSFRIRGNAYYELGMYSEAFGDCQQAIDIFEADLQAHFCQINILIEVGETKDAIEHIDEVEKEVSGTELAFLRGKAFEAERKYASAIKEYKRALKMLDDKEREIISPAEVKSPGGVFFRLYNSLSTVGRVEEAADILQLGISKYPDNSDLLSAMADAYTADAVTDKKNLVLAQECYDKIIENDGSSSPYAAVSAENLMSLNRFDEAEKLLEMMDGEYHEPLIIEILKGTLSMHLDRYDEALKHYEKALLLYETGEVETPYIYRDLSMIHMRLKDYDKAEEYIIKNCELFGDIRDYGYRLELLRIQGKYDEVYSLGEDLVREVRKFEGDNEEMMGELLEEMVGAAIDEGNLSKFREYLKLIPDGDKKEFIRGRFAMYNISLEKAQEYLEDLFEDTDEEDIASEELTVISHRMLTCAKVLMGLGYKMPARIFASAVYKKLQPDNFQLCGRDCLISYTQQAEALAILGKFDKAEALMKEALTMRRCDFCKFSGCLDAWCALAFIYALKGDREKMEWAVAEGHKITPFDYDLDNQHVYLTEQKEKKGLFGGLFKK